MLPRVDQFRFHLSLLLGLTILPAAALEVYTSLKARQTDIRQAKQEAVLIAKLAVGQEAHLVDSAKNALAPLANLPTARSTNAQMWDFYFRNLRLLEPRFLNFGLIETNGVLFASAIPFRGSMNLSNRVFFRRVLKTRRFAVGEFERGPLTNAPTLSFGDPVLGPDGRVDRVLFATVDLKLVRELAANFRLPEGANTVVFDERGEALGAAVGARRSAAEDSALAALFRAVSTEREATAELPDSKGRQRLYGFTTLRDGAGGLAVVVGIPRAAAYADANRTLVRNLSFLVLVALAALAAAQYYASRNVLQPVDALVESAHRLQAGDFTARTGVQGGGDLDKLARTFDTMAAALQRNHDEIQQANRDVQAANVQLERKHEELRASMAELAQNRLELELIFNAAPALIFIKDREHRHRQVNESLLRFHGLSREAIIGRTDQEMGLPDAEQYMRDDDEVVATGKPKRGIVEPVATRQGRRWLLTDKLPFRDETGEIIGVIGFAVDITDRLKLEEQLRQAQKLEAVGTLAGGIAHDFNNILAAINGYTELAMMDAEGNSEMLEHLGAVAQAGQRASELVKRILLFSRQQEQERKPVRLRDVATEALKLLRATIPATIEFKTDLAAGLPLVLADPTQVHQVVMNLGTNAWHAMRDRPGRLEIKLEEFEADADFAEWHARIRPGRYVRLAISDTGMGMDPSVLSRIFEPFYTTKPPGEGTGLGLSVVHGIMENHDGAITVYSQPGEGTVFHLYFPAFAGEEIAAARESSELPQGRGERILFVDDEPPLARLGGKMLERLGYAVTTAGRGAEALDALSAHPNSFDLVITDLAMPGMAGTELAREIHKIRLGMPIILTTGYTSTLTAEGLRASGIAELLLKPLTLKSLGSAIQRALIQGC